MKALLCLTCVLAIGCGEQRMFRNIGDGVGVPMDAIEADAERHGLTTDQAAEAMRAEVRENRINEHAKAYGLTREEAERQIEYADANGGA